VVASAVAVPPSLLLVTVAVVAAAIFVLAFARGAVAGSFGCCFLVCADDC